MCDEVDINWDDELTSISWEITKKEFIGLYTSYDKLLDRKGLTPEEYSFDDMCSDVFSIVVGRLANGDFDEMLKDSNLQLAQRIK